MMTRCLAVWLCLVACGRTERECEYHTQGACVRIGEYTTPRVISKAITLTYEVYTERFDLTFDREQLARQRDLYIQIVPRADIDSICVPSDVDTEWGKAAGDGCILLPYDEIYLAEDLSFAHVMKGLAHELIHFWNAYELRHVHGSLFRPDYYRAEALHSASRMYSVKYGEDSVDWQVMERVQDWMLVSSNETPKETSP